MNRYSWLPGITYIFFLELKQTKTPVRSFFLKKKRSCCYSEITYSLLMITNHSAVNYSECHYDHSEQCLFEVRYESQRRRTQCCLLNISHNLHLMFPYSNTYTECTLCFLRNLIVMFVLNILYILSGDVCFYLLWHKHFPYLNKGDDVAYQRIIKYKTWYGNILLSCVYLHYITKTDWICKTII